MSIATHIVYSKKEPFKRAIVMSGDATTRRPRSLQLQENFFKHLVSPIGLTGASSQKRRDELQAMPADELIKKAIMNPYWTATSGTDFVEETIKLDALGLSNFGRPNWCKQIVFGNTAMDVSIA